MTTYDLIICHCELCNGKAMPWPVVDLHNDPEAMAGIRRGIEDMKAGRSVLWSELKRKYRL